MFPNHFCFEITIITIVTIILYIPKEHEHVEVVRSTSNVAENSLFYKGLRGFGKIKISKKRAILVQKR